MIRIAVLMLKFCPLHKRFIRSSNFQSKLLNSTTNIDIFIAFALGEIVILDVENIYQSCDLGRAIWQPNVNASQ